MVQNKVVYKVFFSSLPIVSWPSPPPFVPQPQTWDKNKVDYIVFVFLASPSSIGPFCLPFSPNPKPPSFCAISFTFTHLESLIYVKLTPTTATTSLDCHRKHVTSPLLSQPYSTLINIITHISNPYHQHFIHQSQSCPLTMQTFPPKYALFDILLLSPLQYLFIKFDSKENSLNYMARERD